MPTSVNPTAAPMSVRFDPDSTGVDLSDGRTLGVRLAWFPRLAYSPGGSGSLGP